MHRHTSSKPSSKSTSSSSLPRSSSSKDSTSSYQVYSHYIQPGLGKPYKNYSDRPMAPRSHEAKKPRLIEQQQQPELITSEQTNLADDFFIRTFIGVDSFDCENIFTNLINNDILLVCLNANTKRNFCFKGKCSLGLLYGRVQINGYYLDSFKWFDLYSPETNSFLSILNANQIFQDSISNELDFGSFSQNIKTCLNMDNDLYSSIESNFLDFLNKNQFSTDTCSLIAIKPLKSQMCNYLNYFENFQHIYQSLPGTTQSHQNGSNFNNNSNDLDFQLSKFGIYPIPVNYFNAVHIENQDEKNVIDQLLNQHNQNDIESNYNEAAPVIMACGGKDVGKSTFLRYLMNSLLNKFPKIAYVDCDPGQSEFTLGSCLSLSFITDPIFGPPHTHINHNGSNKKCYFLGHLSPNDVPGLYLEYLNQCNQDFQSLKTNEKIPLVVNTMGWNQGLGLCLLKESILLFKPTHLIQINHPVEANKNMPHLDYNWLCTADGWPSNKRFLLKETNSMNVETNENEPKYNHIILKSYAPHKSSKYVKQAPQKRISPRDHRNIAIVAYFSSLHENSAYFKPIHHLRPYRISWSKLALHVSHSRVDYDQFFRVFNASLVSLSHVDSKLIKRKEENPELPGYLDFNLNSAPLISCLGFGIVRGINIESREFYILTPEPLEILNQVNLLCKGMLNLPMEFFYEQDSDSPCPYMSFSDNLNSAISNEPIQRKYLIHQAQNRKL